MLPLVATSKKQSSDFRSEILRLTRLWPSFGVAGTAAATVKILKNETRKSVN